MPRKGVPPLINFASAHMRSREGTFYRFTRIIVAAFFLFLAGGLIPGSLQAATQTFSNTASITIPDSGAGIPYPSTINVSGMTGTVTNVTVTLNHLTHTWASDVDLLLKGPAGQKVLLLSDVGAVSYTHLRAHETPEHLVC